MKDFVVGLCALTIVLGLVGWLLGFDPFTKPPVLGRGLPGGYEAADDEFKTRITGRYELPMAEADLVADLQGQGFDVHAPSNTAWAEKRAFVCRVFWRVYWASEDGQVTVVSSRHGAICL